jgi:hypothetical protein
MRFHDIIDLEHPEKALRRIKSGLLQRINIENLHVESLT